MSDNTELIERLRQGHMEVLGECISHSHTTMPAYPCDNVRAAAALEAAEREKEEAEHSERFLYGVAVRLTAERCDDPDLKAKLADIFKSAESLADQRLLNLPEMHKELMQKDETINALRSQLAEMQAAGDALRYYGRHRSMCSLASAECGCGYDDADAAWQELSQRVSPSSDTGAEDA